jgi:hypothetical protein
LDASLPQLILMFADQHQAVAESLNSDRTKEQTDNISTRQIVSCPIAEASWITAAYKEYR